MDIILIPGLWLDGSSWEQVVPILEEAGHRTHVLTLPGMESADADRSKITRRDQVNAVVDAIDAAGREVVLVGHSAGGAMAHGAVDARPGRVAHVVYVGGFPIGDGGTDPGGYPAVNGEVPLPDWSGFDTADLAGLDDKALAGFRERAIPSPEGATRDPQQLSDERRYDVPVTVICTEFTSDTLRGWIARDLAPVREFTRIRDVTYVDLPTGHWPQFTRPEDLAGVILASVYGVTAIVDEQGRPEPPIAASEAGTLLGFLDYQRATLEWKVRGLDAAGLRATVGVSPMTLGGMLKHLAYVEDHWLSRTLHGRDPHPPWNTVDWKADGDWEWHSAAADSPEQLHAIWQDAVARSRELVAAALTEGGLGQLAKRTWPDGHAASLRWILCHMIEEYARHNGHADLIRESVDGETGELPGSSFEERLQVGVEVVGPLQVGQVTDALEQYHQRVVQRAGQLVGNLGGRIAVLVAGEHQRPGPQRRQHGPVVGPLGPAAQCRGGADRVRGQHHVHDLPGENLIRIGAVQPGRHLQRKRAHALLFRLLRLGLAVGDLGGRRRPRRGSDKCQRPPALRLGAGELHQHQPAHAEPDEGGPADARTVQQLPDVAGQLRHGDGSGGDRAVPVAAQVGDDDPEAVTERRELRCPHGPVEGVAVQEHDHRAGSGIVIGEIHGPDRSQVRQPLGPRQKFGVMAAMTAITPNFYAEPGRNEELNAASKEARGGSRSNRRR